VFLMRVRDDASERGTTLLELVVTVSLLGIVIGALLMSFLSMQKSESFAADRTNTLDDMRVSMSRLTREMRQGSDIVGTPTASNLTVDTYIDGAQHSVHYVASGTTLTRSVDGGAAIPLQRDLASTNVFTYSDETPGIVTITLEVTPEKAPDTTVSLESEVRLRNMTEAD
jgi:type II secretory pathway pseudopilin PulG